ncbi:hypothetical protein C8J57DRAFT_297363 [Mycena rebaudengoi]|nr:hypothetical protein C8J57DRAFT_297363 [Mycena rebaudengoi]
MVAALLTAVEKTADIAIFDHKKVTQSQRTRDKKKNASHRISKQVFPNYYNLGPAIISARCAQKISRLIRNYHVEAKRLQGLYIPPSGPDVTSTPAALTLWNTITANFLPFPRLHKMCTAPRSYRRRAQMLSGQDRPPIVFSTLPRLEDDTPNAWPEHGVPSAAQLHAEMGRLARPTPDMTYVLNAFLRASPGSEEREIAGEAMQAFRSRNALQTQKLRLCNLLFSQAESRYSGL